MRISGVIPRNRQTRPPKWFVRSIDFSSLTARTFTVCVWYVDLTFSLRGKCHEKIVQLMTRQDAGPECELWARSRHCVQFSFCVAMAPHTMLVTLCERKRSRKFFSDTLHVSFTAPMRTRQKPQHQVCVCMTNTRTYTHIFRMVNIPFGLQTVTVIIFFSKKIARFAQEIR